MPMPPGHTEDLGRSRYFLRWTMESAIKTPVQRMKFNHRALEIFSAEGEILLLHSLLSLFS